MKLLCPRWKALAPLSALSLFKTVRKITIQRLGLNSRRLRWILHPEFLTKTSMAHQAGSSKGLKKMYTAQGVMTGKFKIWKLKIASIPRSYARTNLNSSVVTKIQLWWALSRYLHLKTVNLITSILVLTTRLSTNSIRYRMHMGAKQTLQIKSD